MKSLYVAVGIGLLSVGASAYAWSNRAELMPTPSTQTYTDLSALGTSTGLETVGTSSLTASGHTLVRPGPPSTTHVQAGPGEHCGGNMTTARSCTSGYHCAPEPGSHLPFGDVGGICIAP